MPVKARIEFKICLLGHKSLLSGEARYNNNLLQPILISSLRSSKSIRDFDIILSRQTTIERSICHCTPRVYNQLPFELLAINNFSTCKKKLKTYFLEKAYALENLVLKSDDKV